MIRRATLTAVFAAFCVAMLPLALPAEAADKKILSAKQERAFTRALGYASKGRFGLAVRNAGTINHEAAEKLVMWRATTVRGTTAPFSEITSFVDNNPDWPRLSRAIRNAERAINKHTPKADIADWMRRHPPRTGDGMFRELQALVALNRASEAKARAPGYWIDGNFPRAAEKQFLRQFRRAISRAHHSQRMHRLLWDRQYGQARRQMRRVSKGESALALARMALSRRQGGVDATLARVPRSLKNDPGLIYDRLKWRRRKGRDNAAMQLLAKPPKNLVRPEIWWTERAIVGRRMLAAGRVTDAYKAVSDHRMTPDFPRQFAEAEWMSGWIALRFLGEAKTALKHFQRLDAAVKTPISKARAGYWAGRAASEAGKPRMAQGWFSKAAKYETTYYGQLAHARIFKTSYPTRWTDPLPSPALRTKFEKHDLVAAARILKQVGRRDLLKVFFDRLVRINRNPGWQRLTADLAYSLGHGELGVRVARYAMRSNTLLPLHAYPTPRGFQEGTPERSLLLAISRQESNFDARAISHAGARGLMQLMPATAREVARQQRVRYSKNRLTRDPSYNIRLGRAYLANVLRTYNGSYVLAVASYNAGPGAVRRWIRKNGDPRDTNVDVVDWVEMIPYSETRNYVQRVLENLQVYRRRTGSQQIAQTLADDLNR